MSPRNRMPEVIVTGTFLFGLLSGCAATPAVASVDYSVGHDSPAHDNPAQPMRIAAMGDSITHADNISNVPAKDGWSTWVHYLPPAVHVVGGWAKSGSISSEQLAGMLPLKDCDILVALTGTNNFHRRYDFEATVSDIIAAQQVSGCREVAVVALAAINYATAEILDFNGRLQLEAAEHGWGFVDPWGECVDDGRRWEPVCSPDGIHPNATGQEIAGTAIGEYLIAAYAD